MSTDPKTKVVRVEDIRVPEWATRVYVSEEELASLAEDIKTRGQIRPIRLRSLPDGKYGLNYGFKTCLAAVKYGIPELRADVVECDERTAILEHLAENSYHKRLHPFDLARKIDYAMKLGIPQAEIAKACNTSVDVIKKVHRLNKLPDWFKEEVRKRNLEVKWSLLYELLRAIEYPFFKEVAEKFLSGELATEKAIREYIDLKLEPHKTPKEAKKAGRIVPELVVKEAMHPNKGVTLDDLLKIGEQEKANVRSIRRCDYCGKPMARDEFA